MAKTNIHFLSVYKWNYKLISRLISYVILNFTLVKQQPLNPGRLLFIQI